MKLAECNESLTGIIESLDENEIYLHQHGFFPGEKIKVICNKRGVPLIVEIRGGRLALRREIAKNIVIKKME